MTILHIDSSARSEGSTTRALSREIVEKLGGEVIRRDLAHPLPHVTEAWVGANTTAADQRSDEQNQALALSDTLVAELQKADTIVIGVPMYNFGIPASLKAWIDLVARAGVTFKYTENGPEGLLQGKRAILAIATGGVPAGSDYDFATDYMRHVLGFIGIKDVKVVAASRMVADGEAAMKAARDQIAALTA